MTKCTRSVGSTLLIITLLNLGCAPRVTVRKNPCDQDCGFRYYRPKPYLLISPAGEEKTIVAETPRIAAASTAVEQVVDRATLLRFADAVWRMPVSGHVVDYAVRIARATRPDNGGAPEMVRDYVGWGAGPRAGQALIHGAKAVAAMAGEPTPTVEHVKGVAASVLRHRVLTNYAAAGEGITPGQVVSAVLGSVEPERYQ